MGDLGKEEIGECEVTDRHVGKLWTPPSSRSSASVNARYHDHQDESVGRGGEGVGGGSGEEESKLQENRNGQAAGGDALGLWAADASASARVWKGTIPPPFKQQQQMQMQEQQQQQQQQEQEQEQQPPSQQHLSHKEQQLRGGNKNGLPLLSPRSTAHGVANVDHQELSAAYKGADLTQQNLSAVNREARDRGLADACARVMGFSWPVQEEEEEDVTGGEGRGSCVSTAWSVYKELRFNCLIVCRGCVSIV